MNKKQKIVLWIGIAVILLIGAFPPWNYVCVRRQGIPIPKTSFHYIKDAGYHFLWSPPSYIEEGFPETSTHSRLEVEGLPVSEVRLNNRRLLAEYIIALPVLGLLFTFAFGAKHHTQKSQQKKTSPKLQTTFSKDGLKPPPGSGFKTVQDFNRYLLKGLDKR